MRRRQIYQMQRASEGRPYSIGINNHVYDAAGNDLTHPAGHALARKMDAEMLAAAIGTPEKPAPVIDPHACPKCHRTVGRGRAMHEKHCKGIA